MAGVAWSLPVKSFAHQAALQGNIWKATSTPWATKYWLEFEENICYPLHNNWFYAGGGGKGEIGKKHSFTDVIKKIDFDIFA